MSASRWIPRAHLPDAVRDAPLDPSLKGLWHIGRDLGELTPRVAIVGARAATSYGLEVATTLAADLAERGVCIVSGMARGIDAAAHAGALSVEGATIAVLAGGADRPYPASSRPLYERIATSGAIVSEQPPGSDHRAEFFLERNRIIAALSLGVVLVQADVRRSGALTTVRVAGDIHREVFAVPGDVRSVLSGGPHELLRRGRAHVCAGAQDVFDALSAEIDGAIVATAEIPGGLDPLERELVVAVNAGPARAEELAARAGVDPIEAVRALTRLELAGVVVRAPGVGYRRPR